MNDDKAIMMANTVIMSRRENTIEIERLKLTIETQPLYMFFQLTMVEKFIEKTTRKCIPLEFTPDKTDEKLKEEIIYAIVSCIEKAKQSDTEATLNAIEFVIYSHTKSVAGGCFFDANKAINEQLTNTPFLDRELGNRVSKMWNEDVQIKNHLGIENNCGIRLLFKIFQYDKQNNPYKLFYDATGNYGKGKSRPYRDNEIRKECELKPNEKLTPKEMIMLCETFFKAVVERFNITIYSLSKNVFEQRKGSDATETLNILLANDHYYQILGKNSLILCSENNKQKENVIKKWYNRKCEIDFTLQTAFFDIVGETVKVLQHDNKIVEITIRKFVKHLFSLNESIKARSGVKMYYLTFDDKTEILEKVFNEMVSNKKEVKCSYFDDSKVILKLPNVEIISMEISVRTDVDSLDKRDLYQVKAYTTEFNKYFKSIVGESIVVNPFIASCAYKQWTKTFMDDSIHTVVPIDLNNLSPDASIYYIGDLENNEDNWKIYNIMLDATYGASNYMFVNKWGDDTNPPKSYQKFLNSEKYKKYFDINSCYPASMIGDIKSDEVDGETITLLKDTYYPCGKGYYSKKQEEQYKKGYLGFYYIHFKVNKKLKFYPLPRKDVKVMKDKNFTTVYDLNDGEGYYTNVDIKNAMDVGYTIEFSSERDCYIYPCKSKPFKRYIESMYKNKMDAENENQPIKRQFCKEMMNSLFGKLGQKAYKRMTETVNDEEIDDLRKKYKIKTREQINDNYAKVTYDKHDIVYKYPKQLQCFILSYARRLIIEYVKIITPDLDLTPFSYIDTDSLRVDSDGYARLYWSGLIKKELGCLKDELKNGLIYYEENDRLKKYVMKYINMKGELKEKRTKNW